MTNPCDLCERKKFLSKKYLNRHMDIHYQNRYYCQTCGQYFSRKDTLKSCGKKHHSMKSSCKIKVEPIGNLCNKNIISYQKNVRWRRGGPRSQLCERLTLRSTSHRQQRTFLAHMSGAGGQIKKKWSREKKERRRKRETSWGWALPSSGQVRIVSQLRLPLKTNLWFFIIYQEN